MLSTLTAFGVMSMGQDHGHGHGHGQAAHLAQEAEPGEGTEVELPEGALGEQLQWLLDTLNAPDGVEADAVEADRFTEEFQTEIPPAALAELLGALNLEFAPFTVLDDMIGTVDGIPETADFVLVGEDGSQLQVVLAVDPNTEQISALIFEVLPEDPAAATPGATPEATPEMGDSGDLLLPEGEMGQHIEWMLDALNGQEPVTAGEIEERFSPDALAETSADEIAEQMNMVQDEAAPVTVDDNVILMTMDLPVTNSSFVVVGADGERFQAGLTLDPETLLITDFALDPLD